jgi:hypothetical protein
MTNYWLFQINPKKYYCQCVKKGRILHWRNNKKGVYKHDIVYFFTCRDFELANSYLICAKGEIISNPTDMDKSNFEKENCLKNQDDFKKASRVKVSILEVLAKPIKIKELQLPVSNNSLLQYIIERGQSRPPSCFQMTEEEATCLDKIFT